MICEVPTARLQFENVIQDIDWCELCSFIYKTSIDTSSREFQFKVMHNYLNTNDKLFKWKLVESRMCSFCFTEPETVTHLFSDCFVVKNFYFRIVEWARSLQIHLPVASERTIVYGYFEDSENWYLISHLINLFKRYVFNNRNKNSLNLIEYQACVEDIKNTEYRIAKKRNKLHVHYAKWGPLRKHTVHTSIHV